jgi:amidase
MATEIYMPDVPYYYMELIETSKLIKRKELSPVTLAKTMLDRIAAIDPTLHSYALLLEKTALREAEIAEREIAAGSDRGPLHGIPIALKDNFFTKGIVTANGMMVRRNEKPTYDATVVVRLREAGAILLGKLQNTEGAFAEHHPSVKPPVNPWGAERWSGSSSSGSGVATAAGLCFASLGTDTGGSIRLPCDVNGVTGIKPTYGRVSRHGVFGNSPTLDHVGPIARSAADAAAMLMVIAGRDENDPTTDYRETPNYLDIMHGGVQGLRIGVDREYSTRGVDPIIVEKLNAALQVMQQEGAELIDVSTPSPEELIRDYLPFAAVEMAVSHEATYPSRRKEYGPALSGFIELGLKQTASEYHKILKRRNDFTGRFGAVFRKIDLLAIPTLSVTCPTIAQMTTLGEEPDDLLKILRFTCPSNMTGNPTIILPMGFAFKRCPITFQFIGRPFEEDVLLRAGIAYQNRTEWHRCHPGI